MTHIKEDDMVLIGYIGRSNRYISASLVYVKYVVPLRVAYRDIRFFMIGDQRHYDDMISSVKIAWISLKEMTWYQWDGSNVFVTMIFEHKCILIVFFHFDQHVEICGISLIVSRVVILTWYRLWVWNGKHSISTFRQWSLAQAMVTCCRANELAY